MSSVGGDLSTECTLSVILEKRPKLIEQLALCLDKEMRLIPNWRHLASELDVNADVIRRLEKPYSDYSPTIRLFEFFEVTQPDLSIKQLKDALLEIKRNDLFSLLTKARCIDNEKVKDLITSRDIQASSRAAGLLDNIALALDVNSLALSSWSHLALKLGVPRKTCWEFERRSTDNPTHNLLQYLITTCPEMKLRSLKEALDSIQRKDLLKILQEQNQGDTYDEVFLKDFMCQEPELVETIAERLNREEVPGVKSWIHLAYKLKVPDDVRQGFGVTGQNSKSPTKEVIKWVAANLPQKTLSDVTNALDRIQRSDAIRIISKQFPGSVKSTLERLGCSLQDSLTLSDPTGQSLSPSYKREEKDSSPKRDIREQSGHCGTLPDQIDLVGRNETCEKIVTALSSNKAVEIVAPPGYGKTSTVIEVAHQLINKGKFIAYVNPRGVTCVEDLASDIIEALGFVPGEDTITEVIRRIRVFKTKTVVLIIENIDNLLHLETKINEDDYNQELNPKNFCTKMRGKFHKDDFLSFLKDLGKCPTVHLILTSREFDVSSVSFPVELIRLEPLNESDSASLFTKSEESLDKSLIDDLVRVCGGIPLLICTVRSILRRENPERLAERLTTCSTSALIRELSPKFLPNRDRIDKCLQIYFNRFSEENQKVFVIFSTFPSGFTEEQFNSVFKSSVGEDLPAFLNSLKQSSLLNFDRNNCLYSLHPFIRNFLSLMSYHRESKSIFIHHYSDLAVTLCETFLTKDCKAAIDQYRSEKDNIREAMAWCGDNYRELDQMEREHCVTAFNKAVVFLAKMMRKQEFVSLFCKLTDRCRDNKDLLSACLTSIGVKIVLSCTCTPHICPRALYQAKRYLAQAKDIHLELTDANKAVRAHCLSKLGFCCVREGRIDEGFEYLNEALKLRGEGEEKSEETKDKVMLGACYNDLAASLMVQRKHMCAIQTRLCHVLPLYEQHLGDHPFTATTLDCIGNSYHALGDYDNAVKYISKSVEIRKQLLGHHQETARSLHDLAVALSAREDYSSALKHFKEAIDLQEEVSDTHQQLIHTHQEMSIALRGLGRHGEAEKEMARAWEYAKKLEKEEKEEEKDWMDISCTGLTDSKGDQNAETEKLVGQQDIQPESELTKGASEESEETELLVGQQSIQPEREVTRGASKEVGGLDLLVNTSGPAELMKQIQQPHGEVKKRSSEVQASREKFGDVSETEKLVGQQDIQPESELTKGTSNESEEAEKLVGQQDKPEGELTEGETMESEVLPELGAVMAVQKADITKEFQAESEGSIQESFKELKEILQREHKVLKGYPEEMGEEAEETATEKKKRSLISPYHDFLHSSRIPTRFKTLQIERGELLKLNDQLLKILSSEDQPLPRVAELPKRIFDLTDNQKEWLLNNLALETFILPQVRKFMVEIINEEPKFPQELLPIDYDRISAFDVLSILIQVQDIQTPWPEILSVAEYLRTFKYNLGKRPHRLRARVNFLMETINVPLKDAEKLLRGLDDFRARGLDFFVKVSETAASMKQIQQMHGEVKKGSCEVQASREKFSDVVETGKGVGQQDIQPESELTKGPSKASEVFGRLEEAIEDRLVQGSEEAQQQQLQYHDIIEKTKEFEALHKGCIRVLPYIDLLSGQVYVQLYVFFGNDGIPEELKVAARKHFEEMGVELKWTDLCSETSDVPDIIPGVSRRLMKSEVDEISKIIENSLVTFKKHRNITAVYPSLKVTDSKRTNQPCIMVNVIGKGRIPIGETIIPKFVEHFHFPVDITEGFWIETDAPSKPIEPQEQQGRYLRLGASIGIKGVAGAGTLGAILEDDDSNYYLLSCDHVIGGVPEKEIIHPGQKHYLDSLEYYLNEYSKLLKRITDSEINFSFIQQPTEDELKETFRELQKESDKYDYRQLPLSLKSSESYTQFIECANILEKLFKYPPRVVADFSYGFRGHVRKRSNDYEKEICIDAAVAKLKNLESAALRGNYLVETIGTVDYPSGNVLRSDEVQSFEREWCKSGSATGYTQIRGSFVPVYLNAPLPALNAQVAYFDRRMNEWSEISEPIFWQKFLLLENRERTFSHYSDSGAVIFEKCDGNESMSAIGIVTAGQYTNNTLSGTIVSPLDISLEILSFKMRKQLTLVSRYEENTSL